MGWGVGRGPRGALGTVESPVPPDGTRLRVGVHANGGSSSVLPGSEPTFADATATLGVTPYCERLYCSSNSDRITSHRARIEAALAADILPILSVKGTNAAYYTQMAADLATFDTGGKRFPIAAHHEPYGNPGPDGTGTMTPAGFSTIQNWLYGAISSGSNNTRAVPASLMNGWFYWSSGTQRRNKVDTSPGNAPNLWRPAADVASSNSLDGMEGIDAYSSGQWAGGAASISASFGDHITNFAKWAAGVGYTDNSGVVVPGTPSPTTRLILGELGSPFAVEMHLAFAALEEYRYFAVPWWDKYDQHMVLDTVNYPAHNPDAVAKRQAWLDAYARAVPANFDVV